jgi:hypothetical protein
MWTDGHEFLARFVFKKWSMFGVTPGHRFKIFNLLTD